MDIILLIVVIVAYFLPAIIAAGRTHHQSTAIFFLNLLLGWTALGWIAAFIWSLTAVQATPSPTAPPPPPSPSSPPETEAEPTPVENLITAKGGQLTYRVMAYRRMEKGELERAVWEALESGELKEPEPGGIATLVTDTGR